MQQPVETLPQAWLRADVVFPELAERSRQQCAEQLGTLVMSDCVEVAYLAEDLEPTTLQASIQLAAQGDVASRELVKSNVSTDMYERLFKIGKTRTRLDVANHRLEQHGRAVSDIQLNTFRHTYLDETMQRRSRAELTNILLFEQLIPTGVFETHYALVWSPATEDQQTKEEFGFYQDTESCSVQLLEVKGNEATLETALVAGKADADSPRHDLEAIHAIAHQNGIMLNEHNADGMLQYVMLVPKTAAPHGMDSIVEMYDTAVGGTFYGEAKPTQDYVVYGQECLDRAESFDGIVEIITNQLLSEAAAFATPIEAIMRLDELSQWYGVKRAVNDTSIDAAVFGQQSALHINEARLAHEQGDKAAVDRATRSAQATADSSSCPLAKSMFEKAQQTDDDTNNEDGEATGKRKWMKCPHCDAKVFDDPCARVLACWDCHALVVNGKVCSTGNGGSKKRKEQQQEAASKEQHKPHPAEPPQPYPVFAHATSQPVAVLETA
ncbi:hypothetical protein KA047_01400 [Candidatus Saccharibacteria bacterium]|nr:hypothetical protein [Candidatus Saccharibacteria bacterium]